MDLSESIVKANVYIRSLQTAASQDDTSSALNGLRTEMQEIMLTLLECDLPEKAETARKIWGKLRKLPRHFNDYGLLCRAVSYFLGQIGNIQAGALGRAMNRVRMGYFPTDLEHVRRIRQAIDFPSAPVNLLDPCCGEGLALEKLAPEQAVTFGVEIDEARAHEATARLQHVAMGSFFHAQISWNSFHALFLNPPYLKAGRRMEKAFLADSLPYLLTGGLLIYIIPYYRATLDVCSALCAHFEQLQVYRFGEPEFSKWKQVVCLGIKSRSRLNQDAEALLSRVSSPDQLPPITDLPALSYKLPDVQKSVARFMGTQFNTQELEGQLKKSRSVDDMLCRPAAMQEARRPLLPLNLSQIGLIGASGQLDGLIDDDTLPHVIKGCIIRNKSTEHLSADEDVVREKEVYSNKLIMNVLAPDGFHSLC